MLSPDEEAAFLKSADKVQQVTERHLRANRSRQSVISFVANVQRSVSRVIQTAIDQGVGIACKAGCSHCCHVRVEAMAPEIFRIARELQGQSTDELKQCIQRLETHVARRSEAAALKQGTACPFLSNDLCTIYDVRPSVCRKAHSLDVEKCRGNAPEIPQNLGVVVAVEALTKGAADAYVKSGFDGSGHELGRAVWLALSDPATEFRWYSGAAVFAADGLESQGAVSNRS